MLKIGFTSCTGFYKKMTAHCISLSTVVRCIVLKNLKIVISKRYINWISHALESETLDLTHLQSEVSVL